MTDRFTLGSVARLNLDIVTAGAGIISQSPTVALQRRADNKWFQASDGSWQVNIVENAMVQTDSVNLPGRYHFDFDQNFDDEPDSVEYVAKKTNTGGSLDVLEYDDLVFGPLAGAMAPELCSVQGFIYDTAGVPVRNEIVRAVLRPVFADNLGRAAQSDKTASTYTNDLGAFDLPLVRGGVFRLEIPGIGFDRKVTIPNQPSVLFTDL